MPNTIDRPVIARHRHADRARGFTLIEVLIVVAIIGIIAAIAIPSYSAYVTKTRRSDATIFLTEAAGEQVRYFSEFNTYTDELTELGYATDSAVLSPEGFYSISAATDGTSFTLSATPVAGAAQASDTACGTLMLSSTGVRGNSGESADCW